MPIEIIPTILVKTFDEVKEKIRAVENYVNWVQLDIMDGIFVENTTWNSPEDLKDFETKVKLEAHLMVKNPENVLDKWLEFADRIIIHFEATENIKEIIEKTHNNHKQIGIALNPETHPAAAEPILNDLDLILIMSVQPGRGGQEFKPWVLEKADFLRQKNFKGDIEIDGGINTDNIKEAAGHGINLFCAGSIIFKSGDIKNTIKNLKI